MLVREVVMRFVFIPLGRYGGIKSKKDLLRFGEQGYNLFYYSIAWSCGVWIMQHSEYRNITLEALWKGYPHYKLTWQLKAYYLMQGAFWVSQIMVINIEKRRKDYYQVRTEEDAALRDSSLIALAADADTPSDHTHSDDPIVPLQLDTGRKRHPRPDGSLRYLAFGRKDAQILSL